MIELSKIIFNFNGVNGFVPSTLAIRANGSIGTGELISLEYIPTSIQLFDIPIKKEQIKDKPNLFVRAIPSDIFKELCIREEVEYEFFLELPISIYDIINRRNSNSVYPLANQKLTKYITFNSVETWFEKDGLTHVSGRMNFGSYAGIVKFCLDASLSLDVYEIEVVTNKIDYENDFRMLLYELADFHSELILSLDKPTEITFNTKFLSNISHQSILLHMRRMLEVDQLPLAIETILATPHTKLEYETETNELQEVVYPDFIEISSNFMSFDWKKGGHLSHIFKGYTPVNLPEEIVLNTYDTMENQFVKFSLQELERILIQLLSNLNDKYTNSKAFLQYSIKKVQSFLQEPFFKQIGDLNTITNSMVLKKRKGYKDLVHAMQVFNLGIQLESHISEFDTVDGDLRPIYNLYEYWCFIKLIYVLQDICEEKSWDKYMLIKESENGFVLNLKTKSESRIDFKYDNLSIDLYYNRNFTNEADQLWHGTYDNLLLHPDFSLKIIAGEQAHWFHFDAKYKLDYKKVKKMILNGSEEGNFNNNDIFTAHAYRDAILGSRGVYILYPDVYGHEMIYIRNPLSKYKDQYKIPSIGAFPLKPGEKNSGQIENIKDFLKNILDILSQNLNYQEETGLYYKDHQL